MTGTEAKALIIKNATPYFEQKGWKLKKVRWNEAIFVNKKNEYFDIIGISTTDYNPEQLIGYGLGKRIEAVEAVMKKIESKTPFDLPLKSDDTTLNILDKGDSLKREDKSYCTSEEDVIYNLGKIFNYLDEHALPLLEKFNDLREIDNLINGEGEKFWDSDWKKPFNLAGRFDTRRLITAKLSGRKDFDELIDKVYESIEAESAKNGYPFTYDRTDLTKKLPYTIHLLKNVKSLY